MSWPVLHQPNDHPYVRKLPRATSNRSVWDTGALTRSGIRVVHVHFGFERHDASDLGAWLETCRRDGLRVVYTAHDLDNPHLVDQTRHHRSIAVLAGHADAVVTLTASAAARLRRTVARPIVVIEHPHVVPLARIAVRNRRTARGPIYVHAATCRPNLDVDLLADLGARLRDAGGLAVHVRLPLDEHRAAVVARLASIRGIRLELATRLDDRSLWRRIESAEALLLPYRWGTHSGLLEAARDLGTPVLSTAIPTLIEQGAEPIDLDDPRGSLMRSREQPVVGVRDRLGQRTSIRRCHADMYRELLDR